MNNISDNNDALHIQNLLKNRIDFQIVTKLIKENSKVLDIGCGDGSLLYYLLHTKNIIAKGIELETNNVNKAIARGIPVLQGDAEIELTHFPSNSYDYIVLSQSLQVMQNPEAILNETMRISEYTIVSIPNFGYWKNRLYLLLRGRMPVTKTLAYEWHNTPNIHFCTIEDFITLCNKLNYLINDKFYINSNKKYYHIKKNNFANFFAEYGVFLLKRGLTIKNDTNKKVIDMFKKHNTILAFKGKK